MTKLRTELHTRLAQTLKQKKFLPPRSRLLVAVSGGQDSVCLLKLLLDLQPKWLWEIAIVHCDHRWSSDVGIAERVQEIALAWNVPCYLKVATSPIPETEAAARAWRYTQIAEVAIAIDCDRAVTGHTQSDRAETFLYNLIRGAGTDGLQALNWQRKLFEKIELIRPLLNISRRETFNFCQQLGLPIWEDAVNNNLKYARNRIRQELIPYLQANFNPQIEIQLCQTAELLTAEVEYLEDCARQCLEEAKSLDNRGLNRSYLRNLPLALQRRIVRNFLREELNKDPNFEQIEALIDLIDAPNQSRTSSLQKNKSAIVKSNIIYLELEN